MMVSAGAGRGGALGRHGGPGPLLQLASEGPFSVGSVMWRDGRGRLFCTVAAKATYELGPGVCAPVPIRCRSWPTTPTGGTIPSAASRPRVIGALQE